MDKKFLTLEEYYTLETYDVRAQELKYKQEIKKLKQALLQKDVLLLEARIKELKSEIRQHIEHVQGLSVSIENSGIEKDKYKTFLQNKYELPKDWGFIPETLEIILGD